MVAAVPHFKSSQLSQNAKFSPTAVWKGKKKNNSVEDVTPCNMRLRCFSWSHWSLTAELLLQEKSEVVASPWIWQQLAKTEGPPLHTHLSGNFHTDPRRQRQKHTVISQLIFNCSVDLVRLTWACLGSSMWHHPWARGCWGDTWREKGRGCYRWRNTWPVCSDRAKQVELKQPTKTGEGS